MLLLFLRITRLKRKIDVRFIDTVGSASAIIRKGCLKRKLDLRVIDAGEIHLGGFFEDYMKKQIDQGTRRRIVRRLSV